MSKRRITWQAGKHLSSRITQGKNGAFGAQQDLTYPVKTERQKTIKVWSIDL